MNTTILTVVLASALMANRAPSWNDNYAQARMQGAQQQKPLAVVFGTGANGWSTLVRADDAKTRLMDSYVCVYVDMSTQTGRNLAHSFSIQSDTGIVISDRTGNAQAFWHQGDLSPQALSTALQRYAEPGHVVRGTETGTTSHLSNYQPLTYRTFAAPAANC